MDLTETYQVKKIMMTLEEKRAEVYNLQLYMYQKTVIYYGVSILMPPHTGRPDPTRRLHVESFILGHKRRI